MCDTYQYIDQKSFPTKFRKQLIKTYNSSKLKSSQLRGGEVFVVVDWRKSENVFPRSNGLELRVDMKRNYFLFIQFSCLF